MKRWIVLLLPSLIWAHDFATLLKLADNNLLLKAQEQEIVAKDALYRESKAKNYPTLSAKLTAIYLKDTPTMHFGLPFPGMPQEIQVGKRSNYTGALEISYPIFSGFAVSTLIRKAELDLQKSRLQKQDAKRRLYLRIAMLYGTLYRLDHAILAAKDARKAIESAYRKATGFYKAGLLAPSELANIEAKKYETDASLQNLENQRVATQKMLSYLTDTEIDTSASLPSFKLPSQETLITTALQKRADKAALQKMLEMDKTDIKLAQSEHYPTLALLGSLKLQGDTLRLNGDGFTNPNKSYVGAAVEWKLFDGFATKHRIDAAKAKKLARALYLKDYQNRIRTILESDFKRLETLHLQKAAKERQLAAQESYYKLTKGRFDNHLSSADELSHAIAAKAAAKAELEGIKAEIFQQKSKILLESSLASFKTLFSKN